jgi:hypothetical protein
MAEGTSVLYQFSKWKVEQGFFSHFLGVYDFHRLPTGRRLREMMGSLVFCIEGYDHDEREIHAIPEVRRFYSAFHAAWPYWLYFCCLEMDTLKTMVMCCQPSLTALKVEGQPTVAVTCDPLGLLDFLKQDFVAMNRVCERAEMFEDRIEQRTRAVFEYFGLPYLPTAGLGGD